MVVRVAKPALASVHLQRQEQPGGTIEGQGFGPVLGTRQDLEKIIEAYGMREVIIAVPGASGRDMRETNLSPYGRAGRLDRGRAA